MASQNKEDKAKRRTVLQTIGTAAGFGLAGVPATARQTDSPVEFEGISYDSKTDVEQGLTRATLEFKDDGVSGELQISGLRIPIDDRTEVVSESEFGHSYRFELDDKQFKEDGVPLKGGFRTDGERLGGHLTRTGHRYHPLGFSMHNVEKNVNTDAIRGILSDDKEASSEIILPDTGVPRLDREKDTPYEPSSQDESPSTEGSQITSTDDGHQIIPTGEETNIDHETYHPDDGCTYDEPITDVREYQLTYSLLESEGLSPDPDQDDDSVELRDGGNRVMYLHGVWNNGNRPENIIHYECTRSDWKAEAISVEYSVIMIEDKVSPDNMIPNEGGGDSGLSAWIDTTLDIVGAFPNPWVSASTSVVKLFLPDEDTSYISTSLTEPVTGGTRTHWEFDLNYELDAFPTEQEEAQTVRLTLEDGGNPDGATVEVDLHSEYSYEYVTHYQECPCYDWIYKTSTTDASKTVEMELVD